MSLPFGTLPDSQKVTFLTTGGASFTGWDLGVGNGEVREVWARERQQNRGDLHLLMDWSQRIAFANILLGGSVTTTGGTIYTVPTSYPDFRQWVCQYIEVKAWAPQGVNANGMISFQYAEMMCRFGPTPWVPGATNGLGIMELSTSSNAVAADQNGSSFYWDNAHLNPMPPSSMPAVHWTSTIYTLPRFEQPVLPVDLVASLVDKTNAGSFYGAPAETVLFHGAHSKWRMTGTGQALFDLTFTLERHAFSGGWNLLPRPGYADWQPFYKHDGSKLFPTADFSPLIT